MAPDFDGDRTEVVISAELALPPVDGDVSQAGTEGAAPSPEEALAEVDRLLDEVEHALGALDDGSYGRCATCGSAIEPGRLAEDALARTCASCAAATEVDAEAEATPAES